MKDIDRKKIPNNNQRKLSAKPEKRDQNFQQKSDRNALKRDGNKVKASPAKVDIATLVSEPKTGTEPSEVYQDMVIDYVDDVYRSEEASSDVKTLEIVDKDTNAIIRDSSHDVGNEPNGDSEQYSDTDMSINSVSSQGDIAAVNDEKMEASGSSKTPVKIDLPAGSGSPQSERVKSDQSLDTDMSIDSVSSQGDTAALNDEKTHASRSSKSPVKIDLPAGSSQSGSVNSDQSSENILAKASKSTLEKPINSNKELSKGTGKSIPDDLKNMKVHPKPSTESLGVVDKPPEEPQDADIQDETSVSAENVGSGVETVNIEENVQNEDNASSDQKIQDMESRIEKLEEELREVAALEVALYSVVPEHGSSAHKVHTPARRLCRLYIHACKHWSPAKRASIARNTVSGVVLIAKSCGHDVSRLTFWLSNTVVLREIISQTFGSTCQSSPVARSFESNGRTNGEAKFLSLKWKSSPGSKLPNKQSFMQVMDDWQETRTFTAALEKVESWIFSRIVESIWWQTLTPNMQSLNDDNTKNKFVGRTLGPPLGDQQQGSFSINLWKNAFQDAFGRLCPVRAGGHECGCLPVLARKVMEQCLARLDVAMFNAILRESALEIPTDPVSDPIVDSKVLPIPAGDLSFGSGAQLKNSIGNWTRWLTDLFGSDAGDRIKDDQKSCEADGQGGADEPKCFPLLSALSDLLMLPKDMLMDRTIRMEVCPQISLPLVKRILCNFTPDEFCPDPVPGAVLEALNAECIIDRRLSGDSACSFPYPAAPVVYAPPSSADVAEKVAEAGSKSQLSRNASAIQNKGYTSDEDLVELDSPLAIIVDRSPPSPAHSTPNGSQKNNHDTSHVGANARYELLREVWQAP